jgi:p-aminobenzoyl-glutamate transporter AbgT
MSASVPVLLVVGVLVTERLIEPRLGEYTALAKTIDPPKTTEE